MSDTKNNSHSSLKRRLTTPADLKFFTPSATTFQPRPYHPSGHTSAPHPKPPPPARNNSLIHPQPPMDPSPTELNTIFIRPPFTDFPEAHLHHQGLTYSLLAANPDWFLDPDDFISTNSTNPNAVTYPSQLEPPRGWCPAKKKDLRERGADSWPEGEEPRLRCTFCRRTYAGVNAKSMWRRHVFEKHKIAMSNRRDNMERSRKSAGKNNKETHEKENVSVSTKHGSNMSSNTAHQSSSSHTSSASRSKFRSLRPAAGATSALYDRGNGNESDDDDDDIPTPSAPRISQEEFPILAPAPQLNRPPLSKSSSRASPTPPPDSPQSDGPELALVSAPEDLPPTPARPTIPQSPYNPLVTPSFRHSPPRLPSDQPWRFPSPSHPLHSNACEMSLSMVVRGQTSPAGSSFNAVSGIEVSPVIIDPRAGKASTFSSPNIAPFGKGKDSGLETLFDEKGLGLGLLKNSTKSTPRRLFLSGSLPASVTDRLSFKRFRQFEESPLRRSTSDFSSRSGKSSSDFSFGLSSDGSSPLRPRRGNPLLDSAFGPGEDPFMNMYGVFLDFQKEGTVDEIASPPVSSPEDSPVVRAGKYVTGNRSPSGEGRVLSGKSTAGLMEAFLLRGGRDEDDDQDDEETEGMLLSSPISKERRTLSKQYRSPLALSRADDEEFADVRPLKKRKRTINAKD
ncbi:hypothetical protein EW146_g8709 [Bondarzewia mesenterica]|uniref:Uncharacterized protein n=1 Tax=Bondarzewia mesenterica TaxID=1095465 RepID=A0A4S4LCP3_9AGAM|nr:hypothetical protein EW146_g8709 [Bondarzewia mesenterica]